MQRRQNLMLNVNISMAHQQYFINSHFFFNVVHLGMNEGNTFVGW